MFILNVNGDEDYKIEQYLTMKPSGCATIMELYRHRILSKNGLCALVKLVLGSQKYDMLIFGGSILICLSSRMTLRNLVSDLIDTIETTVSGAKTEYVSIKPKTIARMLSDRYRIRSVVISRILKNMLKKANCQQDRERMRCKKDELLRYVEEMKKITQTAQTTQRYCLRDLQ